MAKKQKKKGFPVFVILAGLVCPLIPIIYFLTVYRSDVENVAASGSLDFSSFFPDDTGTPNPANAETASSSLFDHSQEEKSFVFTGGDGNLYRSGDLFCDWEGNHVLPGTPFRDGRGNLVAWGSAFYDNRGNLVEWGSPFYDAGDNLVNPRG